jgi:hypothetical protein
MEDFRHLSRLAELYGHRSPDDIATPVDLFPTPRPRLNARGLLISFTVLVLGMVAWWGH